MISNSKPKQTREFRHSSENGSNKCNDRVKSTLPEWGGEERDVVSNRLLGMCRAGWGQIFTTGLTIMAVVFSPIFNRFTRLGSYVF